MGVRHWGRQPSRQTVTAASPPQGSPGWQVRVQRCLRLKICLQPYETHMKKRVMAAIARRTAGYPGAEPATEDGRHLAHAGTLGAFLPGMDVGVHGFGLQSGHLRDLRRVVIGGAFADVGADFDVARQASLYTARLKAVGGFDASRFRPCALADRAAMKPGLGGVSATDTEPDCGPPGDALPLAPLAAWSQAL